MVRTTVVMAVLLSLAVFSDARAEFYKWVDRDGREFITNEMAKIPAEYRDAARPVEVRDDRVSVGKGLVADKNRPAAVQEHKDKYGRGELYWRKRAENLRRQIRDQEDEREILVKQEKDDEARPTGRPESRAARTATAAPGSGVPCSAISSATRELMLSATTAWDRLSQGWWRYQ